MSLLILYPIRVYFAPGGCEFFPAKAQKNQILGPPDRESYKIALNHKHSTKGYRPYDPGGTSLRSCSDKSLSLHPTRLTILSFPCKFLQWRRKITPSITFASSLESPSDKIQKITLCVLYQ
jgi:hypothetical protein